MKINAVLTAKKFDIKNSTLYKNKTTLITFIIMLTAIIIGCVIYNLNDSDLAEKMNLLFSNFNETFINESKPEVFSGLLFPTLIFFLLIIMFSTSIIGLPFIYTTIFLKTLGLSTLLSYIYSRFGLKGIEYSFLIIIPGKFFWLLASMLLVDSSVHMSRSILYTSTDKGTVIKKHIIISGIAIVFLLISVLVDYSALTAFSGLFNYLN